MPPIPPPRIAIVGGGPAGLTLGVLLHRQGIPFTIFERRAQPTEAELAKPSGMLDLHPGSGLDAIAACGLTAEFMARTGECSQDFLLANRDGTVLFAANGGGNRPEIARNSLTELLRGHVPAESIKWGHRLVRASRSADRPAQTALDFGARLGTHVADVVVGADGAWSRVRGLLTDAAPRFTGMHNITVTITHLTRRHPHLAALVGAGSFCALGRRHALVASRGPRDALRTYVWLTQPDEQFAATRGLAGQPATAAKAVLLGDDALLGTFGGPLRALVEAACDAEAADNGGDASALDIRPFYALPHGSTWPTTSGVTLVGDAAHLMLPNGEGANLAMLDALLLSQAITAAYNTPGALASLDAFHGALDPLLQQFEAAMAQRSVVEGKETDALIQSMFGSDDAAYEYASYVHGLVNATAQQPQQSTLRQVDGL